MRLLSSKIKVPLKCASYLYNLKCLLPLWVKIQSVWITIPETSCIVVILIEKNQIEGKLSLLLTQAKKNLINVELRMQFLFYWEVQWYNLLNHSRFELYNLCIGRYIDLLILAKLHWPWALPQRLWFYLVNVQIFASPSLSSHKFVVEVLVSWNACKYLR